MTLFWIISAAMIVAASALLAPTLLRRHAAASDVTETFNVQIAREHLDELVKQKDAGDLSDEEFAQARQDLELALAQDLEGTRGDTEAQSPKGGKAALLISALLIPLVTVTVYLEIGSPQLITADLTAAGMPAGHGDIANGEMPPLGELVQQLRERMEANPGNAEGWFLLGRTYMRLQDYPQAIYAYEKVVELAPEEPAGLLSLADALTMRDDRRVGPRAIELLQKALEIDAGSVTALWLLGNAANDEGDSARALSYWQKAYPLLDEEPQMQSEMRQMIIRAGGEPPASTAALPPIMAAAVDDGVPPAAASTAATAGDAASGGASITVEVALSPALMAQTDPSDTIFVLARAAEGPPMPLAVARHQVADLPLRITLSDAMAMMPTMKLSSFAQVKVTAKVSKSGQAGTQPGDLVSSDRVVDVASPPDSVQLLIDQLVE